VRPSDDLQGDDDGVGVLDLALPLVQHWKLLLLGPLFVGLAALGIAFAMPKTYLSKTVFVPPQQQQSAAAAAISQLGALSGLAGAAGGIKTPADQYLALLQSATVADRLIDAFDLMKVYDVKYRFQARKALEGNVRITLGKKDGLITVEVEDESAQRAAGMANLYVEELRLLTSRLALTEAQQRRVLFETQLKLTRDQLSKAQQMLQASGFTQESLRADAKASAEGYARLRAEATAAEMRLQALRRGLSDTTPEVQQALATVGSLRAQLSRLAETTDLTGAADYVSKFREFKYQETLFELLARQYELARVDESREGALVQVVDEARPAEYKHRPRRGLIAVAATLATLILLASFLWVRHAWRNASRRPETAAKLANLRSAWRRG
jgi:uncharacterized protein involved in exopolysaccharide biosynthesis